MMGKIAICTPSHNFVGLYIFATKACIDNRKKNLLRSNISFTCSYNMVNFGPLAAEIVSLVWGTPANFNGFCAAALAALLHGTLLVGISQILRRWTEGATYIRQGGHYVGHRPTFLVYFSFSLVFFYIFIYKFISFSLSFWFSFFLFSVPCPFWSCCFFSLLSLHLRFIRINQVLFCETQLIDITQFLWHEYVGSCCQLALIGSCF